MPTSTHRPTSASSREVIDVDEFHSKYEDPDGLVQLISGEEWRKSWLNHRRERRAAAVITQKGNQRVVPQSSRQQGQSSIQRQIPQDFPSTLGPSIQKAMSQKRSLPSDSVDPPKPSKRHRPDVGPSNFRESTLSGDEFFATPSTGPNRPHTPSSPDLIVVDERRRQQQSFTAMPSIAVGSSFKYHTLPNPRKQDNEPVSRETVPTSAPSQLERESVDIIELFSDDESSAPMIQSSQQYHKPVPVPDPPIEFSSESEHSESDDDWGPPGLDLNNPDNWLPMPNNANREDGIFQLPENRSVSPPPPLPQYEFYDTTFWTPPPPPPGQILYIWDKLKLAENLRWRPRPTPMMMMDPRRLITRSKDIEFNVHNLNVVTSFKQAPGTINAIEQFKGLTVIGSACDGGLADHPDEVPSPYNRSGSLSVWSDDHLTVLDGHMRRGLHPKHYTINDIKFDPISNSFASIGEDKKCRFWTLDDDESEWKVTVTFPYSSVPHALAFRPGSSILAVAEKKVQIYDLSEDVVMPPHPFPLHDRGSAHMIGSIAWGCESTADHLFASSEPTQRTFTGAHKVFDLQTLKMIYQFDAEEAGDVIAIDAVGGTLGLCTQADANHHVLRLYDIRRRNPEAFASLDLLPFSSRDSDSFEGEMNVATFSPDQIYIALARNDNETHVYDRRMLGKQSSEPMFIYPHHGESKTVSKHELYGVVQAQWLQSPLTTRIGLVTGGEDGCVRLWDPSIADDNVRNGKILAEVNSDVSQFSIGDPFVNEYRLVVGDSSGEVTIFDHTCG